MTLREALHIVLREESLGDMVYTVRDRAAGTVDHSYGSASLWEHPRVTRFTEAMQRLDTLLTEMEEAGARDLTVHRTSEVSAKVNK